VSAELAAVAFQRFADALNRSRSSSRLRAAVGDDVQLDRHDPGPRDGQRPGRLAESFAGFNAVEGWIHRMPPVITFSLSSEVSPGPAADAGPGEVWQVRYDYVINNADFRNSGMWVARLTTDGKIAWLAHRPFVLPGPPEVDSEPPAAHHHHHHAHGDGHHHHAHAEPAGEPDDPDD
jgi:hypothetical protein